VWWRDGSAGRAAVVVEVAYSIHKRWDIADTMAKRWGGLLLFYWIFPIFYVILLRRCLAEYFYWLCCGENVRQRIRVWLIASYAATDICMLLIGPDILCLLLIIVILLLNLIGKVVIDSEIV
jgi:hypothetical protein